MDCNMAEKLAQLCSNFNAMPVKKATIKNIKVNTAL